MPELKRDGHRQRMRASYLSGAYDSLPDYNMLELFLSLVIPRRDVKQLAYDLINKFSNIEGVLNADVKDLMSVNGVGESAAVAIKLVADLNKRALQNRNENVVKLNTISQADEYCVNLLSAERVEKVALITLRADNSIIRVHKISSGTVNEAAVDIRNIVGIAIDDGASAVIVSHNHPDGNKQPSAKDINFTVELKLLLKKMRIVLLEHIVVGNGVCNILTDHPSFSDSDKSSEK